VIYSESFELAASAVSLFEALVDDRVLVTWLAEHARVDAHEGGAYAFWGRDVIWCNTEAESAGEILELRPPHTLVFRWRWKGHESRVSMRVSELERATRLFVEHAFETCDASSDGPGPDMAGCHWRIAVGNLASVLERGRAALRPDYTAVPTLDSSLQLEIEIHAPPAQVFRALLDPDRVRRWMQVELPEIDVASHRYSYGWHRGDPPAPVGPSRIVELVPDRLLVHDWQWTGEPTGQVRFELTPCLKGTRLRLVHTHSSDLSHVLGWSDALVGIRRIFVESGAV